MKRLNSSLIALVALATAALTACQNTGERERIVAELGVEVAAIRYIGDNEGRAERVYAAMEAVEFALNADQVTTVSELTDMLLAQVETANPTEQAFLRAAVALAVEDIGLVLPTGGVLDQVARDRVLVYTGAVKRAADGVLANS